MEILICDDDVTVINQIEKLLKDFLKDKKTLFNIFKYTSGEEVLEIRKKFDIAFIDIEMAQVNGLEVTRYIKKINRNAIIFIITAFEGYLDDAMDLNIFRYISKPIIPDRFLKNLDKAVELYNKNSNIIMVDNRTKYYNVFTKDIIYATIADKKNIGIVTENRKYISNKGWDYWVKKLLNHDCFSRPHYSYIVNMNYVTDYDKQDITIRINSKQTTKIPISRRHYKTFKDNFSKFMGMTV